MGNTGVYTVGQINAYIRNLLENDFALRRITVQGEVSNCKYHNSGHIYFTLKDGTGTLSAVMFARDRIGLHFRMQEGQQVRVTGRISVYERSGQYQLYASRIEQAGQGDLYRRFEELKQKLSEMGMFAEEYKRPIPRFVRRVGIVTAPDGAAIRDIEKISRRRNPYVQLILCPAVVQGEYAVPSIISAIRRLDAMGLDVLIVGRGGGSIEDLWAFNEEAVARAIFDCSTPIISAVGHQTDITIADFVADRRAATPSEAAEIAVYDILALDQELEQVRGRLRQAMTRRIEYDRMLVKQRAYQLERLTPRHRLDNQRQEAADLEDRMTQLLHQRLTDRRHQLRLLMTRLEGNSPLRRMAGGYAYVEDSSHRALRSVDQVSAGGRIHVYVSDGRLEAEVRAAEKKETGGRGHE